MTNLLNILLLFFSYLANCYLWRTSFLLSFVYYPINLIHIPSAFTLIRHMASQKLEFQEKLIFALSLGDQTYDEQAWFRPVLAGHFV